MIRDMKQANRRACLDEELSDEKGLSGMFMPYSLVYYKKGRLFIFLGHYFILFPLSYYDNGNNMK